MRSNCLQQNGCMIMIALEQDVFRWKHIEPVFCVNTGEKPLERILVRPAALSLVLPQNPGAACDSI